MGDLALQRRPNGKYDFVESGGDLVVTNDPDPAILRLLIQDTWIGDDGERAGDSLGAVKLSTTKTKDQVQRICEQRLGVLLRGPNPQLTSVSVREVITVKDRLYASIDVTVPGRPPQNIQVPLID